MPLITNRYSNGLVGVVHIALYVAPASLQILGRAMKRWEWCKSLMHVLCTAAIP